MFVSECWRNWQALRSRYQRNSLCVHGVGRNYVNSAGTKTQLLFQLREVNNCSMKWLDFLVISVYVLPVVRGKRHPPLRARHNAGYVAKTWAVLGIASNSGQLAVKSVKPLVFHIYSECIQSEATQICDHSWLQQAGRPIRPVENTLARQANLRSHGRIRGQSKGSCDSVVAKARAGKSTSYFPGRFLLSFSQCQSLQSVSAFLIFVGKVVFQPTS